MIQVDVFLSFAMGASLATLAGNGLKNEKSVIVNQYFVYTICYLSMIFAPSGVYFVWQHSGWETMFLLGYDELHGIFPCLFALTNVLFGVIGFIMCAHLVRSGRETTAHAFWTVSYTCTFAILTFFYDRFLYPGSLDEWRAGVKYPLKDFFTSALFYSLFVTGVVAMLPLHYAMLIWNSGPKTDSKRRAQLLRDAVTPYIRVTGLISATYLLMLFGLRFLPTRFQVLPVHWHVDRLFAFLVGQTLFGTVIFAPIILLALRSGRAKQN